MKFTRTQKELISRGTMAVVAIALAVGATELVGLILLRLESAAGSGLGAGAGLLIFVIVAMYLLAFTFGCFVFCSWDPAKSNPGRVMTIADKIQQALTAVVDCVGWFW